MAITQTNGSHLAPYRDYLRIAEKTWRRRNITPGPAAGFAAGGRDSFYQFHFPAEFIPICNRKYLVVNGDPHLDLMENSLMKML